MKNPCQICSLEEAVVIERTSRDHGWTGLPLEVCEACSDQFGDNDSTPVPITKETIVYDEWGYAEIIDADIEAEVQAAITKLSATGMDTSYPAITKVEEEPPEPVVDLRPIAEIVAHIPLPPVAFFKFVAAPNDAATVIPG